MLKKLLTGLKLNILFLIILLVVLLIGASYYFFKKDNINIIFPAEVSLTPKEDVKIKTINPNPEKLKPIKILFANEYNKENIFQLSNFIGELGAYAFFNMTDGSVISYDTNFGDLKKIEGINSSFLTIVKKLNDKLIFVEPSSCYMGGCDNGQLFITDGSKVEKIITIIDNPGSYILFGKDINEIFLVLTRDNEPDKVRQLDYLKGIWVDSIIKSEDLVGDRGYCYYDCVITSPNQKFSIKADISKMGVTSETKTKQGYISVEVRELNEEWVTKTFRVITPKEPLSSVINQSANSDLPVIIDIKFDHQISYIVWIGTNKGLIEYNFNDRTNKLFDYDFEEDDSRYGGYDLLGIVGDKLITKNIFGIYIFQLPINHI